MLSNFTYISALFISLATGLRQILRQRWFALSGFGICMETVKKRQIATFWAQKNCFQSPWKQSVFSIWFRSVDATLLFKRQELVSLSQSHAPKRWNPCKYWLLKVFLFPIMKYHFPSLRNTSRRNSRRGNQINSYFNHNSIIRAKGLVPFALCFLVNPVFPVAHPKAVHFFEFVSSRFGNGIDGKTGLTASPQGFSP